MNRLIRRLPTALRRQPPTASCGTLLDIFGGRVPRVLAQHSCISKTCASHRRRVLHSGQTVRWMDTVAHSSDDNDVPLLDQFDSDLERIVPEILDFFNQTVMRKFEVNMAFERRMRRYQNISQQHDQDYTTFPRHALKDVAREQEKMEGDLAAIPKVVKNRLKGNNTETANANSLLRELEDVIVDPESSATLQKKRKEDTGLEILSRAVEEPNVIKVEDGVAMRNAAMLGDGVTKALVLLRTLKEEDWLEFDNPESDTSQLNPTNERHEMQNGVDTTVPIETTEDEAQFGFDKLTDAMEQVRHDDAHLSTMEFNAFLARLALSPELLPDEILSSMMYTYKKMCRGKKRGHPDAVTFEIFLLAFCRRFSAFPTAAEMVHELQERKAWNPKTLEAAAALCERRMDHSLALKLLNNVERSNMPGKRFFQSLINLAKADDCRDNALRVLKLALEHPESRSDLGLDKLLVNASRWRTKNKHGNAIDNSDYIDGILGMLESESSVYVPGFTVWRELIIASANGAKRNPSRYSLVERAFDGLERFVPAYFPDYKLVMHGLDASQALQKPSLATNVILGAINNRKRSSTNSDLSPVPGKEILKAMEICVQWNDISSCEKILKAAESINLPAPIMKSIYHLCVLAFARRGDSEQTEKILFDMQQRGLELEDKFYGALMLCYAMSRQIEQAQYLMRSIESGDMGVQVGPSIYDGYVLACVRCQVWDDVIEVFQRMKLTGMHPPSASSCHGILLAGHRQGRTQVESKELLRDLLDSGAKFNEDIALLSTKLLIPDLCGKSKTVSSVRTSLRSNLPKIDDVAKDAAVQLIRSLRIAEMEEQRTNPRITLTQPGSDTWTAVMKDILQLVETNQSPVLRKQINS